VLPAIEVCNITGRKGLPRGERFAEPFGGRHRERLFHPKSCAVQSSVAMTVFGAAANPFLTRSS